MHFQTAHKSYNTTFPLKSRLRKRKVQNMPSKRRRHNLGELPKSHFRAGDVMEGMLAPQQCTLHGADRQLSVRV